MAPPMSTASALSAKRATSSILSADLGAAEHGDERAGGIALERGEDVHFALQQPPGGAR